MYAAALLQANDERSVSRFHGDEWSKQSTRTELFNIAAEDPGKQGTGDSLDDLITKVATHKCCNAFVAVGGAVQLTVLAQLCGTGRLRHVGLFADFGE